MIPLTKKGFEPYLNPLNFLICKKKFEYKYINDKNYCKVKDQSHYTDKKEVLHTPYLT